MGAYLPWLGLLLLIVVIGTFGMLLVGALLRAWRRQLARDQRGRRKGQGRGREMPDLWLLARDRLFGPDGDDAIPPPPPEEPHGPRSSSGGGGEGEGEDDGGGGTGGDDPPRTRGG